MLTILFTYIWRLTVAGALTVPVVLCAVLMLRRTRAPRWVCRILWAAVFLRFVLLPDLIRLPVSLYQARPVAHTVQNLTGWTESWTGAQTAAPTPQVPAQTAPAALSHSTALPLWPAVAIWLAGACMLCAGSLLHYARLRRQVALAYREDGYYTGTGVEFPFTCGFFRPRIYLPPELPPQERQYILLHEQAHVARGDERTKPLAWLIVCLHWFNPLIWLAYRELLSDMEADCDQLVLARLGAEIKPAYCESLLRFSVRTGPGFQPLAFGESHVSVRIRDILRWKKPALLGGVTAAGLAVCLALVCVASPLRAEADASLPAQGGPDDALTEAPAAALPEDPIPEVGTDAGLPASAGWTTPLPGLPDVSYGFVPGSHDGIDLAAATGTTVCSASGGTVMESGYDYQKGNHLVIDHGGGIRTEYDHLSRLDVEAGANVGAGTPIGAVGSTGFSTGSHLHFAVSQDGVYLDPDAFYIGQTSGSPFRGGQTPDE